MKKPYIDGFVIPIQKTKLAAYKKMAALGGKIWMKHGALAYFECVADDLHPDMQGMKMLPFSTLAKLKPDETVIFSFIIYSSKAHRNAVNKKVMKDPAMQPEGMTKDTIPFDMKRMSYAGFTSLISHMSL